MTIFIDSRTGSKEFVDLLNDGVLTQLDYGDFTFEGNGPNGKVQIGVERKVINDLISSISSGRLSGHQLPGLLEEYYKVYLIVEGVWKANRKDGRVEVFRHGKFKPLGESRFTSKRIWGYLTALNASTGVTIFITTDILETVLVIEELYSWWNGDWARHKSHVMMNKITPPTAYLKPGHPSQLRRVLSALDGIGWEKVPKVEARFKSLRGVFEATEEEWMTVPGIGKLTAKKLWEALHK